MDKYEVYVSVPDKHRSMFRINVNNVEELIEEINSRYEYISECTVNRLIENTNRRECIRFNILEGKVVQ